MTPELPVNDKDDEKSSTAGGRPAETPAPLPRDRRTLPPYSSSKHPLPGPWPQRARTQPPQPREPVQPAQPPQAPPLAAPETFVQPAEIAPVSYPVIADAAPIVPSVTPEHWLPEPEYWLADHQRIPRPPTRPLTRPRRFRKPSYLRSLMLVVTILIGIGLIGAGVVTAGRLSYQIFNAPTPAPTVHPVNATPTLPAKQP